MKGIIYTRVSSEEQVKGTSLEFQEELCRNYCKQKGIDVVAVFKEEGESAKNLSLNNRHQFLTALEFCRKQKKQIDAFIVLRVDRFARNTEDHFAIRKVLRDYGTILHSVTEPIGEKPAEKFIETVLAGAAEYDNALRKQRCTDGMKSRIAQGIFPWKPPLGYKCIYANRKGEKKTIADPPDPETFPIIQRGLREYLSGNYTFTQIAEMFDKWGLRSATNKRINKQFVNRVFNKHLLFYAGIIANPWTGEQIKGIHTPMISEEELQIIQYLKSGKHLPKIKHNRLNPLFPLRRTIKCNQCGYFLTGGLSKGRNKKYAYYFCQNIQCPLNGKCIKKDAAEKEYSMLISFLSPKNDYFKMLDTIIKKAYKKEQQSIYQSTELVKSNISKLEEKRKRLFVLFEDGSYSRDEFMDRKAIIEHDLSEAKVSLRGINNNLQDFPPHLSHVSQSINKIINNWLEMPIRFQTWFNKIVFPEGIYYDLNSGYRTTKIGLVFSLNKEFSQNMSDGVQSIESNLNQIAQEITDWNELLREYEENQQVSKAA